MARRRGRIGVSEGAAIGVGQRLDTGAGPRDDGGVVGGRFAVFAGERRDRFGVRYLVSEHVTERAKLAEFELVVAHGLDLGVVAGGNVELHGAAELVADHLRQIRVHGQHALRRFVRLDAEANHAVVRAGAGRMCRAVEEASAQCYGGKNFGQLHMFLKLCLYRTEPLDDRYPKYRPRSCHLSQGRRLPLAPDPVCSSDHSRNPI
jgi:hypothetical protein